MALSNVATSTATNAVTAPLRLVQVTDTHLYADTSHRLVGMNCEQSLLDVVELIRRCEARLDAVLVTGDVSQDHSASSYQRLYRNLATLGVEQQYWIPGNHDEMQTMQQALGAGHQCFRQCVDVDNWRIVMLYSNVEGEVHGLLKSSELALLDTCLQGAGQRHVLVCLHHNPVPVKAAWLQKHALQNADNLFAVLDRYPRVRAVLFGHIHHQLRRVRNGVVYLGAPSTCIQFHPTSAEFTVDHRNPGYRWLELHASGELRTGVNRVRNKRYPIDFSGIGY